MKRLLIAVAALSLTSAGAVFAQANPPSPSNSDQSATTPPSAMAPTPATVSPPATTDNSAAPGSAMGSTAMVGDQTATNPAPTSYPRCTHKGQDRCRTKGG